MANYDLFHQIVKAMALGEGAKARDLIDQMPDEDQREYVVYVAAAFAELTGEFFDKDHGLVAIKGFVDEMAHAYRKVTPPFKPLAMEAVIRAVFDEDQSLDEIPAKDQFDLQLMALRMMVHKSPEIFAQLDQHLTAAEALAVEWLTEDA
jgi:hypothetical protein